MKVDEIKAYQERQEELRFIKSELEHLRKLLNGAKIVQVRSRYGNFELLLDNAKTIRFNPALIDDLE